MSAPENPFAFPFPGERAPDGTGIYEGSLGMTLRDWFAAHAPAPPMTWWGGGMITSSGYAMWAYQHADAMLAARVPT